LLDRYRTKPLNNTDTVLRYVHSILITLIQYIYFFSEQSQSFLLVPISGKNWKKATIFRL